MSVPPFPEGYRASGILLHVTSLPSPYGIGDVGPSAVAWIDWLHEAGQRWWQALPLGPTSYGDSPYQSLSAFAGNPLLVSLDKLLDSGLLTIDDIGTIPEFPQSQVDYGPVIAFHDRMLTLAYLHFTNSANATQKSAFAA